MDFRSQWWLATLLAALFLAAPAFAEDPPPANGEKCIEQCDAESDKCMADTDGDTDKQQACDDRYSECLDACP